MLSAPGGPAPRARARARSTSWSSIDPYLNETTRHAHVILPPTSPLERAHYDAALNAFAVRNVAKYSPPLFERGADAAPRLGDLPRAVDAARRAAPARPAAGSSSACSASSAPRRSSTLALRTGPHGLRGLEAVARKLRAHPHGIDLGPLESRLPARLGTRDRKVHLAPTIYLADLPRLERRLVDRAERRPRADRPPPPAQQQLVDAQQRAAGEGAAALHAADPPRRRRARGARRRRHARASSTTSGAIELPVEVTDEMMPRRGQRAARLGPRPRAACSCASRATRPRRERQRHRSIRRVIDELSGTSALTGQPVEVTPA